MLYNNIMSSISGNGATQSVFLKMSGLGATPMQYSVGATPGSWTTITTWPVTINNTHSGNARLNVKATQKLTISSSTGGTSGYFIAGTNYITFDGSGNTITIDTITNYPGFIRNGTSSAVGRLLIAVRNFVTDISGASTLANGGGWLCQAYFGRYDTAGSITNCTNNGAVNNTNAGGISGQYIGAFTGVVRFTNCTNNGEVAGTGSGGLCGSNLSSTPTDFISCSNTGNISGQSAGGICGQLAGADDIGVITIVNCFNAGNITGLYAGGMFGNKFANNSTKTHSISNSYNTGDMTGNQCGGIFGAGLGFGSNNCAIDISNCYSIGSIPSTTGGIVGGTSGAFLATPNIRITNCYAYDNTTPANSRIVSTTYPKSTTQTNCYAATTGWTDASANAALIGTPTDISTNNPGTTWTKVVSGTTGNPYVLSAYNAALYSPSSASTGVKIYTTSAGLFTPGYTYQIMYDSQTNVGNTKVDTTRVFASKGSTPKYYAYNNNTFTLTNTNGNTRDAITSSINASTGVITYILPDAPCFLEGTKILSLKNNVEQYRPIQGLRKGDLVKTINNGYLPIDMIGTTRIYNPGNNYRTPNRLYKCSKDKYPNLFEDLYITGCHSILVPYLTDEQWNKTKEIFGGIYVTDNHIRLMAWLDDNAEPFNNDGYFSIYHIALENSDFYMNYGIYANGLLVETCSKRYLRELSGMTLLGEEDCTASQYIGVENKVTHIIDTY